jgi:AraC-like DNA-binding protein
MARIRVAPRRSVAGTDLDPLRLGGSVPRRPTLGEFVVVLEGAIRRSKRDESSFSGYERSVLDPRTVTRGRLDSLLAGTNVHLRDGDVSSVFARIFRLDEYVVARVRTRTGHIVWRPSAAPGRRRFAVVFVARGRLAVGTDGSRHVAAGEAILMPFPERTPITLGSSSPVEVIAFAFETDAVVPFDVTPETVGSLHPSSSVFQASYSLLRALVDSSSPEQGASTAALRSLLKGSARALVRAARVPSRSLWEDAVEIITDQHTDISLDARRIADQLNVSTSTLYRAFADRPRGVAEELRYQRALTASRSLAEEADIPVSRLSRQSGFGSASTLRRALKALNEKAEA